jgi:hypothetical protein
MHDVNTVWLACVGLTSLMLEERNSAAQYDRCRVMRLLILTRDADTSALYRDSGRLEDSASELKVLARADDDKPGSPGSDVKVVYAAWSLRVSIVHTFAQIVYEPQLQLLLLDDWTIEQSFLNSPFTGVVNARIMRQAPARYHQRYLRQQRRRRRNVFTSIPFEIVDERRTGELAHVSTACQFHHRHHRHHRHRHIFITTAAAVCGISGSFSHDCRSLFARMGIPLQDARMPYLHVPSDVRDSLLDKCRDPNMATTLPVPSPSSLSLYVAFSPLAPPSTLTPHTHTHTHTYNELILSNLRSVACLMAFTSTRLPAAKAYPASLPPTWPASLPRCLSRPRARQQLLQPVRAAPKSLECWQSHHNRIL